jgi:hypothetical protein
VSTYREIVGKKIKKVSSDPSSGLDGEMWYNSTTGSLKGLALSEAWSSAANMINGMELAAGFGTQTAALTAGGQNGPVKSTVEEYNGSGWASETALPGARGDIYGSFGTTTAGVVVGGYDAAPGAALSTTLEYNGSSWTSGGAVTARRSSGGAGIETAGLAFGGTTGNAPSPVLDSTQEYGGTSWTSGGAMGTARKALASAVSAPQTNALAFAGQTPTNTAATEEYNGTAWSEGSVFPSANYRLAGTGNGTAALGFGGDTPPGAMSGVTAKYDGTSWTTVPSMGTARRSLSAAGSQTAAVTFGGDANPPITNATEEFNSSTNVVTPGAWASGGALNQGRYWLGSANQAPSNAALGFAGYVTPGNTMYALTEEYDGTTWTEKADLNLARSGVGGAGTATAALCMGGYVNGVGTKSEVEEFNGSSWSEETNLGTARYAGGGAGTQTAAVYMSGTFYTAGVGPSLAFKAETEEYDGSSWSESGDVSTARGRVGGCGTQTAALIVGGLTPSYSNATEEYNGSSWTTGGTYPTTMAQLAAAGSQTSALAFGGTAPTPGTGSVLTFNYDGSTWSTQPNLPSGKRGMGGTGSTSAGLSFGGATNLSTSEEFTGETSTANIKTFSTE